MGGAQRYVYDLSTSLADTRGLAASGRTQIHADKNQRQSARPQSGDNLRGSANYEVVVAMGAEKKELGEKLIKAGVKVHYVKNLVRNISPLKDFLAVFELKRLISLTTPNIIHLNSSKAGVLGSLGARLAKNPNVIFTAHGFAFLESKNWIIKKIYLLAERLVKNFRKKIIAITAVDRQKAISAKVASVTQLVTIYNGINQFEPLSRDRARKKLNIGKDKLVIGTIANDYPSKNLLGLKAAVNSLSKKFPEIELAIIGKGNKFGEIPNAKQLLNAFDIYAITSVKEGHPYSLLEAMMAGLPIVATAVGGIPDTIENEKSGLLINPNNPEELLSALSKLINDSTLRYQLGKNARQKAEQFTLQRMIEETKKVYKELKN